MFDEVLKSRAGIIFISILWGLGLATLFKRACDDPGCKVITYRGPPLADSKTTWKYGNTCYNANPYTSSCS